MAVGRGCGAILGIGAGLCWGVGLRGGGFHQVVRLVKWALQALLIVSPWEWWGATDGLQAQSYVTQMKADYPAGDEEGTPASTDPAFTVRSPLGGGLGRDRGSALEAGTGSGHGPHEEGRCSTQSRADETKRKRKGSFSVCFRAS